MPNVLISVNQNALDDLLDLIRPTNGYYSKRKPYSIEIPFEEKDSILRLLVKKQIGFSVFEIERNGKLTPIFPDIALIQVDSVTKERPPTAQGRKYSAFG